MRIACLTGPLLASGLSILAAGQVLAASAPVEFNANIAATCTLVVNSNGTMTPNPGLQSLSSKNAGGSAGLVSLATTGGVTVSLGTVAVNSQPAGDMSLTTWTQTYSSAGTHAVAETSADTVLNDPGTSTLTVHLEGEKSGSDTFSQGAYSATVTVLCE